MLTPKAIGNKPVMTIAKIREKWKSSKVKGSRRHDGDLSPRQAEMVRHMLLCWLSGYLPSYRELGDEMGIASPNGITQHMRALETKGYVEIHYNQGYQLTDKALDLAL